MTPTRALRRAAAAAAVAACLALAPAAPAAACAQCWSRPTIQNGGLPYRSFLRQRPDGSWERCWAYLVDGGRSPDRLVCQPEGRQNLGWWWAPAWWLR